MTRQTTFCGSELKKKGWAGENMDSLTAPRVGTYNIKIVGKLEWIINKMWGAESYPCFEPSLTIILSFTKQVVFRTFVYKIIIK